MAATDAALDAQALRPALAAWWRPRLHRIAAWVAEAERDRRLGAGLAHVASERDGTWPVPTPLAFTLTGRADRIERRYDGGIAILDYKTGTPPSARDVAAGLAPQLPAGGGDGGGRRVRSGGARAGVRADLLAPDGRVRRRARCTAC